MRKIKVECRIKGYRLADAFRPDANWGKLFLKADLPYGTTDRGVMESASRAVPNTHDLWAVEDWIGEEKKTIYREQLKSAAPSSPSSEE